MCTLQSETQSESLGGQWGKSQNAKARFASALKCKVKICITSLLESAALHSDSQEQKKEVCVQLQK